MLFIWISQGQFNLTDSWAHIVAAMLQTLVINQILSVEVIYCVKKWWLSRFIETDVAHIFSVEVHLLTVFLNYQPSHQLPYNSPLSIVIHFLEFLETKCEPLSNPDCALIGSILISNVCVSMCLLLQRRGSACLLVLVGVQPWEASTQGGCDYVTVGATQHLLQV